jgi:hypothetical protein
MKLKINGNFGQRQAPWAPLLLGYNTNSLYTIGNYGCLITSFGDYIGKNPQEVNTILKANNGFVAGGGNFIWSKCTVLGLNQTYQSPYYDGPVTSQGITKMKALLDEGKPLITHVDFNPADTDDDMHWLLVYGYEGETMLAFDPWTATYITLDVYGGTQRAVIEFRAYDKILPKDTGTDLQAELDQCRLDRDRNWNLFSSLCTELNVGTNADQAIAEIKKLITLEDQYNQKDKQLSDANQQITDLQAKLQNATTQLTVLSATNESLEKKLTDTTTIFTQKLADEDKKINDALALNADLAKQMDILKAQITAPVHKGWKAALINLIKKL